MNICEALIIAREHDKAIRQKSWDKSLYAYHGMDNQLFIHYPDKRNHPLSMAIATLLQMDWELADAPYHGQNEILEPQQHPYDEGYHDRAYYPSGQNPYEAGTSDAENWQEGWDVADEDIECGSED